MNFNNAENLLSHTKDLNVLVLNMVFLSKESSIMQLSTS